MNKLDIENYTDVTKEWLENATPNNHIVKEQLFFKYKNKMYLVDNKNVVLDYSKKELEVACWLENTFGGEIYLLPRVNKPDGIKTADYLWNGEYWDLKEILGNGKNVLYHAIENQRLQARNFIFDFSKSNLSLIEIYDRINKLFKIKNAKWLNIIIIKKNSTVFFIAKKAALRLTVGPLYK